MHQDYLEGLLKYELQDPAKVLINSSGVDISNLHFKFPDYACFDGPWIVLALMAESSGDVLKYMDSEGHSRNNCSQTWVTTWSLAFQYISPVDSGHQWKFGITNTVSSIILQMTKVRYRKLSDNSPKNM